MNKLQHSKSQLELALSNLQTHEEKKDYKEAGKCWQHIQKLKEDIEKLENKKMKGKQKSQQEEVSKLQAEQKEKFKEKWDQEMANFMKESAEMREQLQNKHNGEIKDTINQFQSNQGGYVESGALKKLLKQEVLLASQQKFLQAHKVQQDRKKLQQTEKEQFQKQQEDKKNSTLKKLKNKHHSEKEVLEIRLVSKMEQLSRTKIKQEQEMQAKHENMMRQMKSQHHKENITKKGLYKSKGGQNADQFLSTTQFLRENKSTEKMKTSPDSMSQSR